jgi:septal ring factor EnvC (AmiA/AmiB activator)
MKRNFCLLALLPFLAGGLGTATNLCAQNPAAAAAAREEAEERSRRMAADLGELKDNQALQRQQIAALEKSLRDLSDQIAKANNNAATQESLQRLGEQIKKVDETRVADNKRILETIDELHRLLKNVAATPPPRLTSPPPPVTNTARSATTSEEGFPYVVQKGDTLAGIVKAYRQQNIKVSSEAIISANPSVKWERLQVGQKIFIPKPKA